MMNKRVLLPFLISVSLCSTLWAAKDAPAHTPPPLASDYYICLVADSGLVLAEKNADEPRAPASMVKMMLMLLASEGIQRGDWTLETSVTVSAEAQRMGGTQVYLKEGQSHTVGELLNAIAVASANDAAYALAEGLWGSKDAYLQAANQRAQELGMTRTEFHSPHGLPPEPGETPDQTSPRDMALLARLCVRHPLILQWTSQTECRFGPNDASKTSTNKLLLRMKGCDGLKTGFTNAAGYCLTATAERDGIRLIGVVMGCPGREDRFDSAERLLEDGFARVERTRLVAKGQSTEQAFPVTNCATEEVRLCAVDDLWATIARDAVERVEIMTVAPDSLHAPIAAGSVVGRIQVQLDGIVLGSSDLVVAQELPAATWRWKLRKAVFGGRTRPRQQ